jgi:hypothetical protein
MLTYCPGSLAWEEIYYTFAALFRPNSGLKMELFETTEKDVLWERDFFTPFPPLESKGVRFVFS